MVIPLILYILKIRNGYLAGSEIDWLGQHSVFPDYFRKLFYETKTLFPQFAAELGGGQNIYNFAYYGLFNPLYLVSYALPFVKMTTYIQVVSLLEHMADGVLCYYWLSSGHFKKRESFYASSILVLAASVTYHSSMQLMFVNYMPFLLLALIGYDRYCKKGKYGLLTLSVFFMILTSFYFAVGGMTALFIYGVTGYQNETDESVGLISSCLRFIKWLWGRFYPALFGCFLSLFYLIPVYFAMTAGRAGHGGITVSKLLIPDIRLHKLLYSGYGMGLTAAALLMLCISIFYKKCREKFMAALLLLMLLFPVFDWLLNGGLYLRDKAFIPFLPLLCWLAAAFFTRLETQALKARQAAAGCILAGALVAVSLLTNSYARQEKYLLFIDFAVCGASVLLSMVCWKKALCAVTLAVMAFLCAGQCTVLKEELVTSADMNKIEDPDIEKAVRSVLHGGFYRTETRGGYSENKASQNRVLACGQNLTTVYSSISNSYYSEFRNKVLNLSKPSRNSLMADTVDNPIFLRLMGVRYIVGDRAPAGYEKIGQSGSVNIYENKNAAPAAYVTDRIISEDTYSDLSYPERQLALLGAAVAHTPDTVDDIPVNVKKVNAHISTTVIKGNASYGSVSVDSDMPGDTYLFLEFDVKNNRPSEDVTVTVNGEQNKLSARKAAYYNGNTTFHYTSLLKAGETEFPVKFGKGNYEISNVRAWTGTAGEEAAAELYRRPAALEVTGAGNVLEGTAESEHGGWLITSVPYDKSFQLYVDGRQQKIRRVNTAFVGVPLKAGAHEIRLVYHAPGRNAGIAAALITAVILGADIIRRKRRLHGKI
ncbi:hypothetical protein CLOHYLEM_07339 [[Clostridium] hylemonae DSM 15053]|uniref:Bacterial membrane protein YfhO n=2 Tax=[Clostridium] hylemonae TaxID=89153 RepID=C0C5G3_9FIRM|nr:YfhO family protein [[Clostridium] hylemonae]EEG72700.1 hypothetical protein CLOHYLEM_07339 [[Clostridium] hylemonae DSM 15053]QEK16422.1 hypothetical protein LAJLEIBI_00415 [[Clostridium] hylemonae DSM 15053]